MSRTVYMHIGLAKSGTTYLQHILHANRSLLGDNAVLFPGPKMSEHFMAALDLSGARFRGYAYPEAAGAWARISQAANQHAGPTLISHEMFAPASKDSIDRALTDLDTDDVRVVITSRDIARQIPAVWQERIKNGSEERYSDFLDSILVSEDGQKNKGGFWRQQNLIGISKRWAGPVGPERVTVVTLPQSGSDPRELWRRFAASMDLPDLEYSFDVEGRNQSLGVVESELMRRLNGHIPELPWPQYARRVKRRFAEGTLAAASNSGRLAVPAGYQEAVSLVADRTIKHLEALGCRVVGDLEDLRPVFESSDRPHPDEVEVGAMLGVALAQLGHYISRPPAPKPATDRTMVPSTTLGSRLGGRLDRFLETLRPGPRGG